MPHLPAQISELQGNVIVNAKLLRQCFESVGCCDPLTHTAARGLFASLDTLKSHILAKLKAIEP